jgi:aminoglycoside/choline kinase family phosphotransferase
MSALRPEIEHYLEAVRPGSEAGPIVSGASVRRFYRVRTPDGQSLVLLDYGRPFEEETDDMRLGRVFREAGLRVAEIVDASAAVGCLLLEDLGDVCLDSAMVAAGRDREAARRLLEQAVNLAAQVALRGTPVLARSDRKSGPALDAERFRFEMDFFLEHYVGGLLGCNRPPGELRDALHALADGAADTPHPVLCHRDFHSRNLMLPPSGGMAMVDIQDARWGPDSYDLASLLRDAYIDIDESWIPSLVDLYRSALDQPPAEGFGSRLHRVSAQRMIKALGTFGYQATVRNETRYGDAVTRTSHRLQRLLPAFEETRPLHALLTDAGLLTPPT